MQAKGGAYGTKADATRIGMIAQALITILTTAGISEMRIQAPNQPLLLLNETPAQRNGGQFGRALIWAHRSGLNGRPAQRRLYSSTAAL